jgi:predicted  nucleic acid-binding Zn-ribbon protein
MSSDPSCRDKQEAGVCIIGEARKDREPESELDRTKRDNNDLYKRVAELMEINESHQKLNGKLQERLTEVEEENKKLHDHFNKKIDSARKAGS